MRKKYVRGATPEERFWEHTVITGGCWYWLGAPNKKGYGHIHLGFAEDGRQLTQRVHRFAYELLVGPIPEDLTLDHLCRNKLCVRPDHLEPVTNRENIRRGVEYRRLSRA